MLPTPLTAKAAISHHRLAMKSILGLLTVTTTMLLGPASADAALLLYEPFDYSTGALAGQGGSETGFAPASTWTENSAFTTEVASGSISFGTLSMTGNMFHYLASAAGTDLNRFATRPMSASASSGDLFMTFLMQGPNGIRLNGGSYVNGSNTFEFGGLRSRYNVTTGAGGEGSPHVYYGDSFEGTTVNAASTDTYMYVFGYTGLGTASGGTARMWLLEASHYNALAADGSVSIAELDANNFASSLPVSLVGAAPTLDGTENLRLHLHDNGSGTTEFILDEIRIATTLGEAMAIVPEPSACSLLALSGLALMRRRRK